MFRDRERVGNLRPAIPDRQQSDRVHLSGRQGLRRCCDFYRLEFQGFLVKCMCEQDQVTAMFSGKPRLGFIIAMMADRKESKLPVRATNGDGITLIAHTIFNRFSLKRAGGFA